MKKITFFLLVTLFLGGCKLAKKDPEPQKPADVVAGRYKLSSFSLEQGGQRISLPGNGQSLNGVAELIKSSTEGYVEVLLTVNNANLIETGDLELEVKKTSDAYGLFDGSDQYADADGTNIIFSLSGTGNDGQPLRLSFVGKK